MDRRIHPFSRAQFEGLTILESVASEPKISGLESLKAATRRACKATTTYQIIQLYQKVLTGRDEERLLACEETIATKGSDSILESLIFRFGDARPQLREWQLISHVSRLMFRPEQLHELRNNFPEEMLLAKPYAEALERVFTPERLEHAIKLNFDLMGLPSAHARAVGQEFFEALGKVLQDAPQTVKDACRSAIDKCLSETSPDRPTAFQQTASATPKTPA